MKVQSIVAECFARRSKVLNMLLILSLMMTTYQVLGAALPETPVISYSFPRAAGEDPTTDTFSTSNIVDAKDNVWTDDLRNYWRGQGKIIMKRVDFESDCDYTQDNLKSLFEANLSLYDGLTIDELSGGKMDSSRLTVFLKALEYIKEKYSDKRIIVYSITPWNPNNSLLVNCMAGLESYADLIVEEVYLTESYGLDHDWDYYLSLWSRIDALAACGSSSVLGKTAVALGLYNDLMDANVDIADSLKAQMYYIKRDNLLSQIKGIAIYSPVYASSDELQRINKATMDNILSKLYLRFDETSGGTAKDTSGSANNGTLTGFSVPSCWVPGKFGNALQFDGVDDYVNCGSDNSLELNEFTYAAWINPDTISPQYQQIIAKPTVWHKGFFVGAGMTHGCLRGYVGQSSSAASAIKNGTITANTWQHVAMTYADNEIKLYLNGQLLSATTQTGSGDVTSTSASELCVSHSSFPFRGLMDDVRVYSRALSADEINNIYQH